MVNIRHNACSIFANNTLTQVGYVHIKQGVLQRLCWWPSHFQQVSRTLTDHIQAFSVPL